MLAMFISLLLCLSLSLFPNYQKHIYENYLIESHLTYSYSCIQFIFNVRALQFPLAFILFAVDILFTIFFFNLP